MRVRAILPILLLGLGAVLQACAPKTQSDCGFVQNVYGERISWKGQVPVVLQLHQSVPRSKEMAIRKAAQTWNDRAGKEILQIVPQTYYGPADGRDRANVISFSSTWDPAKLSEQAKTTVHWVGDQIQEADIRVNASQYNGASVFNYYVEQGDGVNFEALMVHELGHVLGLKHNDEGSSVMATYLASNSDRTQLSSVDGANLQCEY